MSRKSEAEIRQRISNMQNYVEAGWYDRRAADAAASELRWVLGEGEALGLNPESDDTGTADA